MSRQTDLADMARKIALELLAKTTWEPSDHGRAELAKFIIAQT